VALVRAGRDPRIHATATWAAISTFQRYTPEQRDAWRADGFMAIENARTGQVFKLHTDLLDDIETHADAYDVVEAVRRLRTPLLIVHGTRDESVPVEEAERLSEAADKMLARTLLIEGAGHTFGAAHPFTGSTPELDRVIEATIAWFREAF
jgi:pimeloyl-ACP methyl ester carboxylesterase